MAQQIKTKFIEDLAITTAKIAANAVTSAKLASSIDLTGTPTAPTAASGTNSTQIATTAFVTDLVNSNVAGLKPKEAVRVASATNVDIATGLENGDTLDGVTLATGDRVLLYGQTDATENGIYVVAASGAAARADDFDSLTPVDEINRAWVSVQAGSKAGQVFVQYGTVTAIGTDDITFTHYDPIASLVGGDMITVSGSTISVDLATSSGLESTNAGNSAGQLRIKLEASSPSLAINGSNELGIATGGVTNSHIADGTIDLTAKVTGILPVANGGTGLSASGSANNILQSDGSGWVSQDYLKLGTWSSGWITGGTPSTGDIVTSGRFDVTGLEAFFHSESATQSFYEFYTANADSSKYTDIYANYNGVTAVGVFAVQNGAGISQLILDAHTGDATRTDVRVTSSGDILLENLWADGDIIIRNQQSSPTKPAATISSTNGSALLIKTVSSATDVAATINTKSGKALALQKDGGDAITITVPDSVVAYEVTLPAAQGAADTYLKNNGSGGLTWSTITQKTWAKESITLSGTDITNQYVDLAHDIDADSLVAFVGRLGLHKTTDYTTSVVGGVTRVTFANSVATGGDEALASGDVLFFTYQY